MAKQVERDPMDEFLIPAGRVTDPIKAAQREAGRAAAIEALEPLLADIQLALDIRVVDRKELCARAGVTEFSLSRWLNRKTIPSFQVIERVNSALYHILKQPDKAFALTIFRNAKANYRARLAKAAEAGEGASA